VFLVDYRLAPEHPFPAAIRDCAAAVASLLQKRAGRVVLAGDSAGGGLAAAVTSAFVRAGRGTPDGLICLSGWLDLTVTAQSYETNAQSDRYFSRAAAQDAAASYLQGWRADDPLASPIFAEPEAFPPTLLVASTSEVLLDDAITFAARLARADVPVRTVFCPGLPHAWPAIDADSAATTRVLMEISAFNAGLPE
jgi:monoterpene epsilon-lactone hydrolase